MKLRVVLLCCFFISCAHNSADKVGQASSISSSSKVLKSLDFDSLKMFKFVQTFGLKVQLNEIVFTKSNKNGDATFNISRHQITDSAVGEQSDTTTLVATNVTCKGGVLDKASGKIRNIFCTESKPEDVEFQLVAQVSINLEENGTYTASQSSNYSGKLPDGLGVAPLPPKILGENLNLVILK